MSADQEAFLAALTYVVTPTHDSIRRLPAGTCFSNSFQMLTAVQAVMVFGFKYRGGGIAQWVERPTENPDAILMQVRIPGVAFFFSFPQSAFSADFLTVSVQSPCAIACINFCAHVKNPKHWQPYFCLDARKYGTDRLVGMGSAALAAAVPYPGKAT